MHEAARIFEEHRLLLQGIAYRMIGTMAEAQDVVQDTYLKWSRADTRIIRDPRAWLVTACSRQALDVLKSARVRRESYCGVWLPEPFLDAHPHDPAEQLRVDESVSVALMVALERLSPPERAAFLLHEVFAYSFDEIASILGKSTAACRKLASRARAIVQANRPRFETQAEEHRRLLDAFLKAAYAGELSELKTLLAESAQLHSDGGGKADAAAEILMGADTIAHFMVRVLHDRRTAREATQIVPRWFNGAPGVLIHEAGRLVTALSVAVEAGVIQRIFAVRNPDKLAVFGI